MGVILWAAVAILASNHLYEHTGGQCEALAIFPQLVQTQ